MSKIYEALLRAEQDRAEQDHNGDAPSERKLPAFPSENAVATTAVADAPAHVAPEALPAPVAHVQTPPPTPPPTFAKPTSFAAALATPPSAVAASTVVAPIEPPVEQPVQQPAFVAPPATPAHGEASASEPLTPAATPAPATPAPATLPLRPSDDRFFSPEKVRRVTWGPALASLPALGERGASVEQFRSLRSRMFEFRDLNRLKSVMISSGLPQEGKSFVAINLAISFARHKAARVLLIDGDMRRSTLHKLLGTDGSIGLTEYLSGSAGLLDIMQQIEPPADDSPARLGLASLSFIPGGSESDKAADLSGNPRFTQLMQVVAPHYDWIVVDSAPVNIVADGVNLARACDGVLLVARGGVTKYEAAQRALMELKASTILGFVLNAVEVLPQTGGYYGYESYDSAI
jgi:protein-tyrosine kinase